MNTTASTGSSLTLTLPITLTLAHTPNPNPDPNPNPNQVLPRGRRSVGFVEFRGALLPLVARKKDVPLAELVRSLLGDGRSDPGQPDPCPCSSPYPSPNPKP